MPIVTRIVCTVCKQRFKKRYVETHIGTMCYKCASRLRKEINAEFKRLKGTADVYRPREKYVDPEIKTGRIDED